MNNNLACKWDSERTGERRRPVVFVSSSVYDKEDMLRQIFDLLATNGYEPWMSFKGSIATASYRSAFGNCLHAVEESDLFIGVISPWYGSGVDKDDPQGISITHKEMRKARDLDLPRLFLVDDRVMIVRRFLDSLGFKGIDGRRRFRQVIERDSPKASLGASHSCDIRSIDLYDEMVLGTANDSKLKPQERTGNWIQGFHDINDVKTFLAAQFSYLQWPIPYVGNTEAVSLIGENFRVIHYNGRKGVK